ncbi:MAG: serine/threonine protein kinase, partial [Lachnospiraceae bacterium]|nr:serine/threonine protein kinase [Lachnospiraceae bacterium]
MKCLHKGECATVWLAENKNLLAKRIIKVISRRHPHYSFLIKEAKTLQQFHHPAIPLVYDVFDDEENSYLIEEYIEGETLKQYLLKRKRLSAEKLLEYSIQLCEILCYIHAPDRRVFHLDIKPENILISAGMLKLVDFGSSVSGLLSGTKADVIFSNVAYSSYEMLKCGNISVYSDLFSFGKVVKRMATYSDEYPKEIKDIYERCLLGENGGFESADEVLLALSKIDIKRERKTEKESWFCVTGLTSPYESTDIAVKLASYLKNRKKKKVLLIDCNPAHPWDYNLPEEEKGFVLEFNGIYVARHTSAEQAYGWKGRGYSFVICDFGNIKPLLCNIPFESCLLCGLLSYATAGLWKETLRSLSVRAKTSGIITGGDLNPAEELNGICNLYKAS